MIWLHGREKFDSLLEDLNKYHKIIKFTWEISDNKLPFLDVMVSLNSGSFGTDVYHKPTDTHQYPNFGSCHLPHVKRYTV